MASWGAEATVSEGPMLSMMSKRLRALRKKHNRILQMEDNLAQGKPLNKEQEEVLRSKPAIVALIDEYEKLRQPLAAAVQDELSRAAPVASPCPPPPVASREEALPSANDQQDPDRAVMDILTLLYFGFLFDVKQQSEFAATMLTRTHERGCCLTYDYVTDDATELLGEQDLDAISALGSLVTSRSIYSGVSHMNALQVCLHHAKLWLMKSDQPIHPGASITYAELREKLNKILASDYFTTTPEMKDPSEVVAAVGKYGSVSQLQISESTTVLDPIAQSEGLPVPVTCHDKEDEQQEFQGKEVHTDPHVNHLDEQLKTEELHLVNSPTDSASNQEQLQTVEPYVEDQNQSDIQQKEQEYQKSYQDHQNTRVGGGSSNGRRGYLNGRGSGRGGRGDSGYHNAQGQYYETGYFPRNSYNAKGRGGRSSGSGSYSNHGGHVHVNLELDTSS